MKKLRVSKKDKEYAFKSLRETLKPGDTVYTVLRHVSRSGMMRHIDVYAIKDGQPLYLTGLVSDLLGEPMANSGGLKVTGCGMDMGFHVVYGLSYALYHDGYACIEDQEKGIRCPSAFHVNTRDKTLKEPIHKDGYALNHRWL